MDRRNVDGRESVPSLVMLMEALADVGPRTRWDEENAERRIFQVRCNLCPQFCGLGELPNDERSTQTSATSYPARFFARLYHRCQHEAG